MNGNLWEWNWDIYGDYSGEAQTNPHGAVSGSYRVIRGGSWYDDYFYCAVSFRGGSDATSSGDDIGFRCVRISP